MSIYNRLDLQTLGSQPIMPKITVQELYFWHSRIMLMNMVHNMVAYHSNQGHMSCH